jgi:transposase
LTLAVFSQRRLLLTLSAEQAFLLRVVFSLTDSGESEPQKKISREGDRYLRTMMVQGAHYILEPFGEDRDLRRWGLKLAERGGKMPRNKRLF